MAWTRTDGWGWMFCGVDHYTAEAWAHLAKTGDRFAALQPVYDAVIDRWGQLGPAIARGLQLRHDWGPQYRSGHFLGLIAWLGIAEDAAFLGEPETNGCAERWIRTLKEQCLWAELHDTIDQLRHMWSPRRNRTGDPILTIDAPVVHDAVQHLTYPRNHTGERRWRGSGREAT